MPLNRLVLFFCFSSVIVSHVAAQKLVSRKPAHPIVCYGSGVDQSTVLPPPPEYMRWKNNPNARTASTTFVVTYIGFTESAKASFQKAVDIWSTLITSPKTIHITAQWQPLDAGVLGSAIWGSVYANFPGAPQANTYYPVALAEKIANQELNGEDEPDIIANFSSTTKWSYSLTGTPAAGKYDLTTVVLHELGHGLGFVDSYSVSGTQGYYGVDDTNFPMIYDLALVNGTGKNIYHDFILPSISLKTQLTSTTIYYNTPLTLLNNNNAPAKIYAPSAFSSGSSISHLDEDTFSKGSDKTNSLMTPQIGTAEVMLDPGPIVKGVFSDIGWVFTSIQHNALANQENVNGPFTITAKVTSDAGTPSNIVLHYSIDALAEVAITMIATANVNEYAANIPATNKASTYAYYISAKDNLRSYTNPGKLTTPGNDVQQTYFSFITGPDTTPPVITHIPKEFILNTDTALIIQSTITDNLGIKEALLEYTINDLPQINITRSNDSSGDVYNFVIDLPPNTLAVGDVIKYRIYARDVAVIGNASGNVSYYPSSFDYVTVKVLAVKAAQDAYVNNFDVPTEDFYGDGFSIITPDGFSNPAIHSIHPYLGGLAFPNHEHNITYQLLVPIRVSEKNGSMSFDEIVLVEPGEKDVVFGDPSFYDYVIVEGSTDGGETWKAVADGYDAQSKSDWLARYNSKSSGDNSTAVGDPSLYHTRTLSLLNNFSAGDEVILRFRLFSDEVSVGWGWSIDNLDIQGTVTGVENPVADLTMKVYPNPAQNKISVALENQTSETIIVTIINALGRSIVAENFISVNHALIHDFDLQGLPSGLYIIMAKAGDHIYTKKFIKEK